MLGHPLVVPAHPIGTPAASAVATASVHPVWVLPALGGRWLRRAARLSPPRLPVFRAVTALVVLPFAVVWNGEM